MAQLSSLRIAVIATDGVEEAELSEPLRALKESGAQAEVIAPHDGPIQAFRHHDKSTRIAVDQTLDRAKPEDYDALVLPGGALNADALRVEPRAQAFVRHMQQAGKPIAVICHAPWILISAGVVSGRTLTSYHTIADDLRNAGAHWQDQQVVVEGNWVSSRHPGDLEAFNRELLRKLAAVPSPAQR
ncbi:type 1 glutamine amidotransferase domain-containing protein [Gloeobacter kilaueensis]|uniref:Intracellular protease, PfpI family n=1 Tax=Gloeobacter kilaueensis (strain ATCC BAA-2537 / CCAP 1431/1 / ULC 316 / JS1) TaxID=1183438 RepID=U5QH13_GLOK1|nr:type 1 glutamine amidotransferase domain-containing protein [Gloeobacter kilaueensis]AGY58231.1 intracellular protease, PfpI family [Gloeobacter kilaueensis JS1]